MPSDPSKATEIGTYAELADMLEPGGLGVATDTNNITFMKSTQMGGGLVALTDGLFATPPITLAAARTCVPGDVINLVAGGLPTLPPLTEALVGANPLDTPAPAWKGCAVRIKNSTGAAINVATGAGASINGAAVGTAYALAAAASVTFVLDSTGTNWAVF